MKVVALVELFLVWLRIVAIRDAYEWNSHSAVGPSFPSPLRQWSNTTVLTYPFDVQLEEVNRCFPMTSEHAASPSLESEDDSTIILALATTVIETEDEEKRQLQRNTLQNLAALAPHVLTVVFNASSDYKSLFNTTLRFHDSVRSNRYGTPIFKELILVLERTVNASFYGYCNGDLLFEDSVVSLLAYLRQLLSRGVLLPRTFVVGRRTNIFAPFPAMTRSAAANTRAILAAAARGHLFQADAEVRAAAQRNAQDFFFFTKGTFKWGEVKDVVIGRPGYDNYLVSLARRRAASLVDATNAVVVLHQTDRDGVKAGHRPRRDRLFNLRLLGSEWQNGRTEDCDWRAEQFPRGWFALLRRRTRAGTALGDDFLREERAWLRRWIRPADVCAEFEERVVQGVLRELCARVVVVVREGDYVDEMRSVLPSRVEVLSRQRVYNGTSRIHDGASHIHDGANHTHNGASHTHNGASHTHDGTETECTWVEGADVLPEGVDVVVLNGKCAMQLAAGVWRKLKTGGVLVVRGGIKLHYPALAELSSLEMPGKEFKGMTVYCKECTEKKTGRSE